MKNGSVGVMEEWNGEMALRREAILQYPITPFHSSITPSIH
jgi:hypothetical protein